MNIILYRFFLALYHFGIRIVAFWNPKARLWVEGRKSFPLINFRRPGAPTYWMHCASLGEFEQGRPLVEQLRNDYPESNIIISFFSASGYKYVKNFPAADQVIYLPTDSPANARKLIDAINPTLVLWIKYEYWYFYLTELQKRKIPILLISGVYRPTMIFFKWYGNLWRRMLQCFTHFFVQNSDSKEVLEKLVPGEKITMAGDTRFDRVISIAGKFNSIDGIERFCGSRPVIVAGSTWEDDEAEWVHYVKAHPEIQFIIAPHEIDTENLKDVQKQFPGSIFYSDWIRVNTSSANPHLQDFSDFTHPHCLIIDNIGMLSRLYHYASICYVGGGFGFDGLHNILEAAVYGKPVLFGPEYDENFEAVEMMENGGAISISSALELEKILTKLLSSEDELNKAGEAAKNYVYDKAGATGHIMDFIKKSAF